MLGQVLGEASPRPEGMTAGAADSAPAAEGAAESAVTPDGGAAAPADVAVAVPDYVPDFGPMVLSAPHVVPVAVPVPADADVGATGMTATDEEPRGKVPAATSAMPVTAGATGANPAANPGTATAPAVTATNPTATAAATSADATPEAPPPVAASPAPTGTACAAMLPVPQHSVHTVPQDATAPAGAPAALPFTDSGRLTPQLAGPLFLLASAAPGQHVMTLKVSPEDLGPMTVRAHIDATGVRIELFAPGDAGREALRIILPELRRGLAESGLGASLDLSDHGAPPDGGAGEPGQDRRAPHGNQPQLPSAATAEPARRGRLRAAVVLPGSTPAVLDILV
ncbi:flagellar hook-length control protein FliK [Pseudarthrobacter sp. NBSH8]|uniref:flagellar hook-length control protein FliK n=1 Tax=Pseudarthrobacter sp. NBSH8 TaxID=2596911 RepID=UPI001629738F|nr:flagellar hook-length control protein FliK [Pseudarthrobacter sp. NBSH8]